MRFLIASSISSIAFARSPSDILRSSCSMVLIVIPKLQKWMMAEKVRQILSYAIKMFASQRSRYRSTYAADKCLYLKSVVNKYSTICLIVFSTWCVCAQNSNKVESLKVSTNTVKKPRPAPIPTHIRTLNTIEAQIAATEAEIKRLDRVDSDLRTRSGLLYNSGQSTKEVSQQMELVRKRRNELSKVLANLKLQALDLRSRYGIAEPNKR